MEEEEHTDRLNPTPIDTESTNENADSLNFTDSSFEEENTELELTEKYSSIENFIKQELNATLDSCLDRRSIYDYLKTQLIEKLDQRLATKKRTMIQTVVESISTSSSNSDVDVKSDIERYLRNLQKTTDVCECVSSEKRRFTTNIDYFKSITQFSIDLVNEVIAVAEEMVYYKYQPSEYCLCSQQMKKVSHLCDWPTIRQFNEEVGLRAILKFLKTFKFKEKWLASIKFIGAQSDENSDFYLYEVMYSIPTNMYPIPQVTASLYFDIEVCRVIPESCPVLVTYRLEGSRIKYNQYDKGFTEDLLFMVIDSKLALFKSVTF